MTKETWLEGTTAKKTQEAASPKPVLTAQILCEERGPGLGRGWYVLGGTRGAPGTCGARGQGGGGVQGGFTWRQ